MESIYGERAEFKPKRLIASKNVCPSSGNFSRSILNTPILRKWGVSINSFRPFYSDILGFLPSNAQMLANETKTW
jgi:hypothetical protein